MISNSGYHQVQLYDAHLFGENSELLTTLNSLPQMHDPDRNHTYVILGQHAKFAYYIDQKIRPITSLMRILREGERRGLGKEKEA